MATQDERRLGIGAYAPSQLGQPEPDPNPGAAWGALGRALMYSSDAEAIRARNQAKVTPPAASAPTQTQQPAAATPAPRQQYNYTPDPMQGPAMGMSVRNTSVDGIRRIDKAPGLNSPLFTNLPTGEAISGMQGGTVNTIPASAMRSAGPQASAAVSSALQAAAARGDWDAVRGFYQRDGGTWQGRTAEQDASESRGPAGGVIGSSRYGLNFARKREDRAAALAQERDLELARQRNAFALEDSRLRNALTLEDTRQRADQPLRDAQVRELEQRARPQGQAMPRVDGQVLRALVDTDPEQAKTYFADTENQRRTYGVAAQALALAQQDGLTQQQIMSDPRLREAYVTVYGPPRFAGGGLVPDYNSAMGYAQGGMVRGAGYGQTPQAAAVLPEVNEYRDYAMGAKSLGLPAVPFEQFLTLRQGAKQVAAAQPQGGAMAFANGGEVPDPRDVGGRMVMDTDPNAPTDSIPAMVDEAMPAKLDSGEFVIPKDVVQFFGTDKLNKLIAQARQGQ